jgi:3-hydroxybutyryl-CoA dehydrogenase
MKDAAIARIKTSQTLKDLSPSDFVIEAATEKEEIKKEILRAVCPALLKAETPAGFQHLVDLDHAPGGRHRPAAASSSACIS